MYWCPSGTIDALFIYLLQWAKEQPYQYFNLGMAPLSNVGQQEHAFLGERVAATIFNNVHYIYGFQGLRNFKNKYNPEMEREIPSISKRIYVSFLHVKNYTLNRW
ncbi:phosphatidylglycerol lysyltransferase domain-containing protein [Paracerasibacillus soli]|uniref:Phosphatidylglycerol lysyltransferase domain-containing protein n=1 Tax=Paracerasibacillus soli TaxID=480284 RepID=A0ABU5CVR4_9BACI|nr:phosphatidylglycerol lysyltransferase domain-containing protein [Virgibacillus soli]MDY0410345.1 phosphatidylglycerol lysyltransferase domain-containing protein [Virgibacillus soli]